MNNNFDKFKKKILREHLVYSLIYAVCAGLVMGAISLMVLIFAYKDAPGFAYPVIVSSASLVAAAITFILYYRHKKPSDEEIALRIDSSLSMQEKVATMVEFQNEDGLIINKQREDATSKLSSKDPKALPVKLRVMTLPIILICGGLFAASFFTPSKSNPFVDIYSDNNKDSDEDKKDDQTKIDDKTKEIGEDTKKDIDEIDPNEQFNQDLDNIIDNLVKDLEGDTDATSRQDKIDDAKDKIDDALEKVNNNDKIGDALSESDDEALKMLGKAIKNNDVDGIKEALEKLKEEIDSLSGSDLANKLQQIADQIRVALDQSSIPEGDATRDALDELADALEKLSQSVGTKSDDEIKEEASKIIDEVAEKLIASAEEEKKNEEAAEKAKEEIDKMKDPSSGEENDDKEDNDEEKQSNSDKSGEENGENQGDQSKTDTDQEGNQKTDSGAENGQNGDDTSTQGSGETRYAGDDKVYTPDGGSQEYGEVIENANNDANKDNSENAGEGEDDISDLLEDYFKYLYGDGGDEGTNP